MSSYLTFINNTSYPLISVYLDDELIADTVFMNCQSKKLRVYDGSHELNIQQNREKTFQKLYVSLTPDKSYTLVVKNNKSFFI